MMTLTLFTRVCQPPLFKTLLDAFTELPSEIYRHRPNWLGLLKAIDYILAKTAIHAVVIPDAWPIHGGKKLAQRTGHISIGQSNFAAIE